MLGESQGIERGVLLLYQYIPRVPTSQVIQAESFSVQDRVLIRRRRVAEGIDCDSVSLHGSRLIRSTRDKGPATTVNCDHQSSDEVHVQRLSGSGGSAGGRW